MPLLSSAIPNLVNGVSQQAPSLRLASQLEVQENAFSSVVEGLGKRTPTKHIKKLGSTDISAAFLHLINRDSTERYVVTTTNGDLKVYGIDGTEKTVAFPNGKAYLNTSTPNTDMRALTVQDYTFVVNTSKTTAMTSAVSATAINKALVTIKQGQYSVTYKIRLGGVLVSSYTTSGTSVTDLQTDNVAAQLVVNMGLTKPYVTNATYQRNTAILTQTGQFAAYSWTSGDMITLLGNVNPLTGHIYACEVAILSKISNDQLQLATVPSYQLNSGGITGVYGPIPTSSINDNYTFARVGSTIQILKTDGTQIDCTVEDTFGNRAITVATTQVQRFSDLPTVAPDGYVTKVVGDNGSADDDYYVKFVATTSTGLMGNGSWVETIGPGVKTTLDTSTMPHVLVRENDGTFTFKEADWTGRTVGDTTSSPDPSFVGSTIQDIFFYRGRLGVLSGENVILSVAGSFFKFFNQTATSVLDSDPVDVAATHTKVSNLKYAIPFREELLLFSDQAQFTLSAPNLLTPNSPSISPSTEFEASLRARPVGAGANVYFAFPRGSFAGVREYFVQPVSDTKDASDITSHVPKYIPGTITKLAAATNEDILIALSSTDLATMYVYKYYWVNDQKLQSSWSRYTFETGAKVLFAEFIESTLYVVVQRADGAHLEKMSFEPGAVDTGSTFVMYLDRRLDETQVTTSYDSAVNRTTFTLPYAVTGTMQVVARAGNATIPEGVNLTIYSQSGTSIVVNGSYASAKVFIGQAYTTLVTLSEPVIREDARGGGQSVVSGGRLQIGRYTVNYSNSGYFRAEVTPTGRSLSTKVFNGLIPGVTGPGSVNLRSGSFHFLVMARSSEFVAELINDTPFPCFFTGAEWEGHFTNRSQRA